MKLKTDKRAKYDVVIGLEVHAQLLTSSKIFAADVNSFGDEANTNISAITLGHPGTLPKFNKQAMALAVKMGLACHSAITRENIFDRKNYFYPDLPKGYQLTQDKTPICVGGYVSIKTGNGIVKQVKLHKIHLEEDAGKSIHVTGQPDTLMDYNRAGVPLIEIVTDPVLQSSEEAGLFLTEVRKLVRYLEICDGNMEQGSLRCDANISIKPSGSAILGQKVEIKNMNSIRNVQRAIEHEIDRQIELKENNVPILSETRTFNADDGSTSGMRTKETLNDYRYFPDPDLSPVVIDDAWMDEIKSGMCTLPWEYLEKFQMEYQLSEYDASFLSESKDIATFFESVCSLKNKPKSVANWMMGPVKNSLNENNWEIGNFPLSPKTMSDLIHMVGEGKLSFTAACQEVYPELLKNPGCSPMAIAEKKNLLQESDQGSIQSLIDEVLEAFPEKVKAYRHGKKGLIGMFMGEVMKKGKNKVDPKVANELLRRSLG